MKCPVCSCYGHNEVNLHSDGFAEGIIECSGCGAIWSVNHGLAEIINDPAEKSFLSVLSETVDGDDYCWV